VSETAARPTGLVVAEVRLVEFVVEPQMRHCHPVLRQRASLVGADCRRGTQSLNRLEVLHQTVLAGHALGGARQTHLLTGDKHPRQWKMQDWKVAGLGKRQDREKSSRYSFGI